MSLFDINVMLGPTSSDAEPSLKTADELLREMDRLDIAEALVYAAEARYCHPCEGNWALLQQIEGHRDRLHPCWMLLPPATAELPAPTELVRQMRDNGVRAGRMLPGQHIFPVSERVLRPLLEALADEAIPLIVDLERSHWSELSPWDDIFGLCEAHPRLPIILLRECGSVTRSLYHLWDAFPNLYLETSYLQTACCLEEISERFGPTRLLFGSGMPEYDASGAIATVRASGLTAQQRADIAGNNARRLLGLDIEAPEMTQVWPVGSGGFRVWDAHGHLGPWYKCPYPVYDAAETVKRMDEVGVERIVISDLRALESEPDSGNARLVEACARFPGRIYGYAGYSPNRYADDVAAFQRILDQPGMVGIKLHCDCHKTPPDSPKYRPAYELANERSLAVLTHGVLAPDLLRKTLTELPNMIYVAAHFAAGPPEAIQEYIAVANELSNFYLDTTGSQMRRGAFARLVQQMPVEQIVYGCDFPVMDFPYQLGRVLYADISDEAKRKILWENPARIFRI